MVPAAAGCPPVIEPAAFRGSLAVGGPSGGRVEAPLVVVTLGTGRSKAFSFTADMV